MRLTLPRDFGVRLGTGVTSMLLLPLAALWFSSDQILSL